MDEIGRVKDSKKFCIPDEQFLIYNKGHAEIGDHNMDKNGKLTVPVTFKIIKKEQPEAVPEKSVFQEGTNKYLREGTFSKNVRS